MKILKFEQRSPEWVEARKGKVTGSKLNGIVVKRGTSRKIGFYELIAEQLAANEDQEESAMERGERLEDAAREIFMKEKKKKLEGVGLCVSDENPSIALSPDGFVKNSKGKYTEALEIKCLSSARHLQAYFEKEIPSEYEPQAMQYFIVNPDLETLYFMFYDPRITVLPFHFIEIKRGDVEEKISFYKEYQERVIEEVNQLVIELSF